MLKSDLCDYSDAYIVAKGTATVTGANDRDSKKGFQHLKIILHMHIKDQ